MTATRCCATLPNMLGGRDRRCVNEATVTRFGKRYCYMHTPVVKITDPSGKMKRIAKNVKWSADNGNH